MAKTLIVAGNYDDFPPATVYYAIAGRTSNQTESGPMKVRMRTAGSFADGSWNIITNGMTDGSSVYTFRVNGVDGNQTVTVAFGTTGLFQDTTHSDAVIAGDYVNWKVVFTGTAGPDVRARTTYCTFAATTNTITKLVNTDVQDNAVTVNYMAFNAALSGAISTEANTQFKFQSAGTLKNLFVNVSFNSETAATTFKSRIGGANGNLVVTVNATTTGVFEDTVNTDTISSGNLVNFAVATTDAANIITGRPVSFEFVTTDSSFQIISGAANTGGLSIAAGATKYIAPGNILSDVDATEANVQIKAPFAFTASNLECFVIVNGGTTAGTLDLRNGAASTALTVSITALTTGYFEDTVNTTNVLSGDLINLRVIGGATAATTYGTVGFKGAPTTVASVVTVAVRSKKKMLLGVGL